MPIDGAGKPTILPSSIMNVIASAAWQATDLRPSGIALGYTAYSAKSASYLLRLLGK
jgi:hypothetical protein